MRVVVVGATGNVGTSTLAALRTDARVTHVVGLARRPGPDPDVEWHQVDIRSDDLVPHFRGADAVVHLAWALQPARDEQYLHDTNVIGSQRIFDAVHEAEVQVLVYSSSVGAYSPAIGSEPVDETWPTNGVPSSVYSRQKAYVERLLDRFELLHPVVRVVRIRPALVFKAEAASEIRRLFLGRLSAAPITQVFPDVPGLRFQAVHADDVGDAFRVAVTASAVGAYNVAADPVLDPDTVAQALHARRVPVPARALRVGTSVGWRLRLQPTEPGWVDLALAAPIMDTARARGELGWEPKHSSTDALVELVEAIQAGRGGTTAPLARAPRDRAAV